jgi:broad specificity phosphatase PhoE
MPRMQLSVEGRRQARALAEYFGPYPLAAIYSSPMLRARTTADYILTSQPQLARVRVDSDLIEVRNGWQGEPLAALESIDWDLYLNPRGPDDESLQVIQARMLRWLRRMLRRHAGADVLGVSHGDPILVLAGTLRGLPLDPASIFPRPYIETGALFRMEFDAHQKCQAIDLLVPHAEAAA